MGEDKSMSVESAQNDGKMARYSYAFQGIPFFCVNPKLWCFAILPLICCAIAALVSLIVLFAVALVPQARALSEHMPEWLGYCIAAVLVLMESFLCVFMFSQVAFGFFQEKLFENTMKLKGVDLTDECCANFCVRMGLLLFQVVIFAVTLPLNFIPILGTIAFCYLNAMLLGWQFHEYWLLEVKELTFKQLIKHVASNSWSYTTFGAACIFLSIIPGVNFLFIFTNYVGSALWAADIELGKVYFNRTKGFELYCEKKNQDQV